MNLSIILYVHIDLITTIYQTLKVAFIFIENVTQYIFFSLNSSRSSPTLLPTQLHILSLSGGKKKLWNPICLGWLLHFWAWGLPWGNAWYNHCHSMEETDFPSSRIYSGEQLHGWRWDTVSTSSPPCWDLVCLELEVLYVLLWSLGSQWASALWHLKRLSLKSSPTTSAPSSTEIDPLALKVFS